VSVTSPPENSPSETAVATDTATAAATDTATSSPEPAAAAHDEEGDLAAPPADFAELGLSEPMLRTLEDIGFDAPTDVQAAAIPAALEGRDLLVQSRTGSGKTAAFAIPLADRLIDAELHAPQALALAPTRELAQQVARECARIGAKKSIKTAAIYGGAAMSPQVDALAAGAQLVVATPGRLLDHLRRKTLDASAIRLLVLDECDEMLSMGFQEEINAILEYLPEERQTMLFSATIPPEIERMTERHLQDPVRVLLSQDFVGVRAIRHAYYVVSGGGRMDDLLQVLEYEQPGAAIVFCNTRDETARVAEYLRSKGLPAEGISSDLSQSERERVLSLVRSGKLRLLVATDVAARGIDIADLTHVINYTFPDSADSYVHRTGRTGRAGKSGAAISLVSAREIGSFYYLKLIHRIYPERRHLPTPEEIATRREAELYERLARHFAGHTASEQFDSLARRVWSTPRGYQLIALALQQVLEEEGKSPRKAGAATSRARASATGERSGARRTRSGRKPGSDRSRDSSPRRSSGGHRREERSSGPEGPERSAPDGGSFTTADGDVEFYETVEPGENRRTREPESTEGMVRLYVNVGRRHKISGKDIAQFIRSAGELSEEQVGRINQRDRHTYVEVDANVADALLQAVDGKELDGRPLRVEHARPRSDKQRS
jgi:ATP-dependent RNA helicase DeaD